MTEGERMQVGYPTIPSNPMLKKSVENFLTWVKNNNVEFTCSEQRVLSVKHKFCGTYDFEAIINGKNVLGDIKTSSGIWPEQWLQVAGYKGARLEEFPDKKIDHTIIVRCGKDGKFEVKALNNFEANYQGFLSALNLYKHMLTLKKPDYIT